MQDVENYEYEMPSDFEDEEIDEECAFTEEDKKLYAGWFDKKAGSDEGDDEGEEEDEDEDIAAQLDSDNFDQVCVRDAVPVCVRWYVLSEQKENSTAI